MTTRSTFIEYLASRPGAQDLVIDPGFANPKVWDWIGRAIDAAKKRASEGRSWSFYLDSLQSNIQPHNHRWEFRRLVRFFHDLRREIALKRAGTPLKDLDKVRLDRVRAVIGTHIEQLGFIETMATDENENAQDDGTWMIDIIADLAFAAKVWDLDFEKIVRAAMKKRGQKQRIIL